MNRRTARNHVFCLVFQLPFHEAEELDELIGYYLEGIEQEEDLDSTSKEFIIHETSGTSQNLTRIDAYIEKYAVNWELSRIFKADLALMRIAIYELLFREDIPVRVAINEAVLLSKDYGNDNSSSFINGILGKIAQEIRGQA